MADSDNDTILLPLLDATKEQKESCLSELISTHAEPVIKKVVQYRLRISKHRTNTKESWDSDDVCGNAMMQVLSQLSKFSEAPNEHPIRDFRGYTAVVAHHACNQYFRDKFPKRTQLSNKLRYLLNHQTDFGSWMIDQRIVCGLSVWKNKAPATPSQEATESLSTLRGKETEEISPAKLSALVKKVFEIIQHPLFFDDLITLIIDTLGLREQRHAPEPKAGVENTLEQIEDRRANTAVEFEHRLYLKKLWNEMIALPLRQRTALLFSMRDHEGGSVLYLLPVTGVASIHAVAESLMISTEDLARLWDRLPLEDNEIASRLGVARQQVINLRRSARERLTRKMKLW